MDKYKKINLTLLFSSLILIAGVLRYWEVECGAGNCSYELRNTLLRPFLQGGISLSIISGFLIFLPSHYFQAWFKKIFSWAFPLSVILVAATQDGGSILSFSKAAVVQILGVIFGIVSAYFVLYRFLKLRKQAKG